MTKHIYVDYSGDEKYQSLGGVGILVREREERPSHLCYRIKYVPSYQGELVALLLGLRQAQEGDVVYTDQDFVVDDLLEYGLFRNRDTTDKVALTTKIIYHLNQELTQRQGVSIVGVQNGHGKESGRNWTIVDRAAKIAAGLRSPDWLGMRKNNIKQVSLKRALLI